MTQTVPKILRELLRRYDPSVFELDRPMARIRLEGAAESASDVILDGRTAKLEAAGRKRPDAILSADPETWRQIAHDLRGGMAAYQAGRLRVRRDLHLGVGFLAATAGAGETGLHLRHVGTDEGPLSVSEAGAGDPVLLMHGLGATKVSFLPTVAALAGGFRTIAVDLPGFGDSVKPLRAAYDPAYFARSMVALLDALELERAHLVGNSMGGRVAIEVGLRYPERVGRIGLLAPSLAWLRGRPWAPLLRLVAPQLGLIQPAPRVVVEKIVDRVVPGATTEWTAAGIDEFLRSYLTPRGRAAFYAAARNIYLEEPHGPNGLWTRLSGLRPDSLFVWGRKDPIVPISFERHVREALPGAQHLELDCGHVPQLERPKETHEALSRFLRGDAPTGRRRAAAAGRA
jgi:pimeloyl-ACP methyl ester carboxylesterase